MGSLILTNAPYMISAIGENGCGIYGNSSVTS